MIEKKDVNQFRIECYDIYSNSINRERAMPDINDGMKAVIRRILWSLLKTHNGKLFKSATIVGETIGKYHPHGEVSIYQTLVNIANDSGLIDVNGNWGEKNNLTPTPAAAMRYTECKLSEFGKQYLQFNKETHLELSEIGYNEPSYFPVLIPYALISGMMGIGCGEGTATEIPKFKYEDLISRLLYLKGKASKKEIYPCYGPKEKCKWGLNVGDWETFFTTGEGTYTFSGNVVIEDDKTVVVTYIPYCRNPETILNNKKLKNLIDLDYVYYNDESYEGNFRIVFTINSRKKNCSSFVNSKSLKEILQNNCNITKRFYNRVYCGFKQYNILPIDNWLLYCFDNIKKTVLKRFNDLLEKKKITINLLNYLLQIRPILKKYLKEGDNNLEEFKEEIKKFVPENILNDILDIKISKILTMNIDIEKIKQENLEIENKIKNIDEETLLFYK